MQELQKTIGLVIISKNNEAFIEKILKFIKLAGYKTKQRTTNESKHNLFRFLDSDDKSYPEQLELFAIHDEYSKIVKDKQIIPIDTGDDIKNLSAILLNDDYYNLLVQHTTNIDGLNIATAEVIIPLKMHAYINLINIDSKKAKKHIGDIIKLAAILDREEIITLKGKVKENYDEFMLIFKNVDESRIKSILKSADIYGVSKKDIIDSMLLTYE